MNGGEHLGGSCAVEVSVVESDHHVHHLGNLNLTVLDYCSFFWSTEHHRGDAPGEVRDWCEDLIGYRKCTSVKPCMPDTFVSRTEPKCCGLILKKGSGIFRL